MKKYLINDNKNNRGQNNSYKKSFDFKLYKKNTIKSLNEIEYFLNNLKNISKIIKIKKILK